LTRSSPPSYDRILAKPSQYAEEWSPPRPPFPRFLLDISKKSDILHGMETALELARVYLVAAAAAGGAAFVVAALAGPGRPSVASLVFFPIGVGAMWPVILASLGLDAAAYAVLWLLDRCGPGDADRADYGRGD
jgi:hypothetical protein